MAFEPFNSVGGFTVGIPPTPVINENGFATLSGLQVFGITNLGSLDTIIIDGGEDGYVLQTDGMGRLSWTAQTGGGGGNGSPGGSNTEVQFNNAGTFGGDPGFTYNNITNQLGVSGNIVATNFTGTGNINIAKIIATGNISANYFLGNGSQLTGIVSASANFANYAGNITVSNQPNITSLGTLTALSVTGNVTANYFLGNGALLTGIANSNYAPLANFANYAGNVTVSNQPNITTVGTLTTLSVSGNVNVGNVVTANYFIGSASNLTNIPSANIVGQVANALVASTVYTNAQPNITSIGTLTSVSVSGNATVGNLLTSGLVTGATVTANQYFNALNANITGTANLSGAVNVTNTGILTSEGNVNFNNAPNVSLGSISNLHIGGGVAGYLLRTDGQGNLSWTAGGGGGNGTPGGNTTTVQFNDNGVFNGSGNFTFNQYSNTLTVDNVRSKNEIISGNLTVNTTSTLQTLIVGSDASLYGNVDASQAPNVSFGPVGNIHIEGGTNGQYLQTDGNGTLSWSSGGGGGNGTPGGTNTQIQFNDTGAFGGSPNFTYNDDTKTVNIGGDLIANSLTVGSGIYKFSRTSVYFATSVTTNETLLMTFPTADTAGLDFTIISTDAIAGNRQICKLEAVYYDNTVHYSEYNTIQVNGPVGNFAVTYEPGNVINPPMASLYVFPTTSNMTTYKIQVTAYAE